MNLSTQSDLCLVYMQNPLLICSHPSSTICFFLIKQESSAAARTPRDAASVLSVEVHQQHSLV